MRIIEALIALVAVSAGYLFMGEIDSAEGEDDLTVHARPPDLRVVGRTMPARVLDQALFTEEVAKDFHPALRNATSRNVYDPIGGSLLVPNRRVKPVPWPEHPKGEIAFDTNNRGFREDEDTEFVKTGYRILVTGDSHTDGAVRNQESFANVLEARFAAIPDGPTVEVLNAGVGGNGPFMYLRTLYRHGELDPDLFISTLFTGNDFWDSIFVSDFFTGRVPKKAETTYSNAIYDAAEEWPVRIAQGFNQAFRFRHMPEEVELALTATLAFHVEMARLCEKHGVRFLTVILPTKSDVELEDDRESYRKILDALQLTDDDYNVTARLSRAFAVGLAEHGIRYIDTTAALIAADGPFYWRKDHHLNVEGHRFVADLIFDALRDEIP